PCAFEFCTVSALMPLTPAPIPMAIPMVTAPKTFLLPIIYSLCFLNDPYVTLLLSLARLSLATPPINCFHSYSKEAFVHLKQPYIYHVLFQFIYPSRPPLLGIQIFCRYFFVQLV